MPGGCVEDRRGEGDGEYRERRPPAPDERGAGRDCDGQVLVYHDVLGIEDRMAPKFVRRYGDLGSAAVEALAAFAGDVRSRRFPDDSETYHLSAEVAESLSLYGSPGVG